MKIAQVCPYDFSRPGGVQRHIADLSATLRERGHQVTVIAPPGTGPADASSDGSIIEIGWARLVAFNRTTFEVSAAWGSERRRLDAVIAAGGFDVIHFHTIQTPFLPAQVFRCSRSANVATFHDVPPRSGIGAVQRRLYPSLGRWLMPRLDGVILASEVLRSCWRPGPELPLRVVPPCTDLTRFRIAPVPRDEFRDGRINILFLSRLEIRKGTGVLLHAYRELCRENLPVRLLLAGDGPERAKLERIVRDEQLSEVVFVGAIDPRDTPQWYAACDVFCAPSLFGEGFGIVLTEAMASGKPIAAAANDGYHLVMQGEGAQFLSPPGDVAALAANLRRLVTEPALRQALGAWGQREALRFDCRVLAPQFEDIYARAIQAAADRGARTAEPAPDTLWRAPH